MKRLTILAVLAIVFFSSALFAAGEKFKMGIVVYSNDAETVWNAFRLATFSISQGDEVKIFLLGKGVDYESLSNSKFDIKELAKSFISTGGQIFACGTCLKIRQKQGTELCPVSNLMNLYTIIKQSDKIITF
jgi:uncharacterized protein involved in oxidation of intracellular sulfur